MAATGGNISQRIALEGAQEIAKQLADIGVSGERALKQIQDAAAQATTNLSTFDRAVKSIKDGLQSFGGGVASVVTTIGNFKIDNLSSEFRNLGDAAESFGKRVLVIEASILAAATAVGLFIKSSAAAAVETKDNADALGLSIEAYQALQFAAAASGIEQDQFASALKNLSKNVSAAAETQGAALAQFNSQFGITSTGLLEQFGLIGQSADRAREALTNTGVRVVGIGEQFEGLRQRMVAAGVRFADVTLNIGAVAGAAASAGNALQQLGVRVIDANGKTRPLEDTLVDLADKFQKLGKGPQATALAIQLFGRNGQALLPLLLKGREGVEELIASFRALGIGIGEADAKIGEEATVAFTKLAFTLSAVKNALGLVFAPALAGIVNAVTAAILRNQQALKDFAQTIAQNIKPVIEDIVALINGKAPSQGGLVESWKKSFDGFKAFITDLFEKQIVPAFNGFIAVLDGVAAEINSVFGTELTGKGLLVILVLAQFTGVLGLLVAGATAAAAAIITIVTVLTTLGSGLAIVGAALATITGLPVLVVAAIAAAIIAIVVFRDDLKAAFAAVGSFIAGIFTGVIATIAAAFESVKTAVSGAIDSIVSFIGGLPSRIADVASGIVSALTQPFQNAVAQIQSILQPVVDFVQRIIDLIAKIKLPSFGSGVGSPGGEFQGGGFAGGGQVFGPGTSTSDSIFARLSRGEFVINAKAVDHFGAPFFAALNNFRLPKFSIGGLVDHLSDSFAGMLAVPRFVDGGLVPALAQGSGHSRSLTLVLDGRRFGGLTGPDDVLAQLERHATSAQVSATGKYKPRWVR